VRQEGSRRPRLVIGPGLLMALLVSAIIAYLYMPSRQQKHGPPKVEHQLVGRVPQPALTIAELLKERAKLRLSREQLTKLRSLDARWGRDTQADRKELGAAERRLDRWLRSVQQSGERVTQAELQQRWQEYSRLSAKVAYWRRLYWKMALDLLMPEQRRQSEDLARRALSPRPKEEQSR